MSCIRQYTKSLIITISKTDNLRCQKDWIVQKKDWNPVDLRRFNFKEGIIIPNAPDSEKFSITPGKGKHQKLSLNNNVYADVVFLRLFPKSKFENKVGR